MGAFYQTSTPQQIDFGYQLPTQLMMAAVQNADAQVDAGIGTLDLLGDAVTKIQHLDSDSERVRQLSNTYRQQVDELTTELAKNPQDWRKRQGTLRELGRKIKGDFATGEVAAIQGNFGKYQTWLKDETDRLKKGDITAEQFGAAKSKYLKEFKGTGYDPLTGSGSQIAVSPLAKHVDINKRFDEYLKDTKANAIERKTVDGKGMYLIKTERGEEWIDEARLERIATDKFMADDEAKAYVKQAASLGILDPAKVLSSAMRGAVGTYAYKKTKTSTDVSADPVKAQASSQAHAKSMQEDSQTHAEAMIKLRDQLADENRVEEQKLHDRNAKFKHNLDLIETPVKIEEAEEAGAAAPGTPKSGALGTSTSTLNVFDKGELNPDYLRTKVVPLLTKNIADHNARIKQAEAAGDKALVAQLVSENQMLATQWNAAQGLINQAKESFMESKQYQGLSPVAREAMRGYQAFLDGKGLTDNQDNRLEYANAVGLMTPRKAYHQQATTIEGQRAISNELNFFKEFSSGMDKYQKHITKHAETNEIANKYDATGISINLGDPTVSGLINQAFNLGNVSTYAPNTMGGRKPTGEVRGLGDYDINTSTGGKQFSVSALMEKTGAKSPSELFEEVVLMPSTNGNARFKVRLKSEVNGKTIDANDASFLGKDAAVRGLGKNREMIMEVQGTNQNAAIMQKLASDPNPEISKLAHVLNNSDNTNFRNKINTAVRDVNSSDPDKYGVPQTFGYGNAIYKVAKAGNGKVKTEIKIGDRTAVIEYNDDHDAELGLINIHSQLSTNPESFIKAIEQAGYFK